MLMLDRWAATAVCVRLVLTASVKDVLVLVGQ